jgi:hypothetical protein
MYIDVDFFIPVLQGFDLIVPSEAGIVPADLFDRFLFADDRQIGFDQEAHFFDDGGDHCRIQFPIQGSAVDSHRDAVGKFDDEIGIDPGKSHADQIPHAGGVDARGVDGPAVQEFHGGVVVEFERQFS